MTIWDASLILVYVTIGLVGLLLFMACILAKPPKMKSIEERKREIRNGSKSTKRD